MDKMISSSQISDRHSIKHLLMSERLSEAGSPKIILGSIMVLFGILFGLLVWSIFVEIDEITTGTGEIVPFEKIKAIQHLEGGIIFDVYVKEGDLVEVGAKLFELSPEAFISDLKRLKKRQNALEIEIFRLQALLGSESIDKESFAASITYQDVTEPSLLNLQVANAFMLYQQQVQQKDYNRTQLANRLKQERRNLKNTERQLFHFEQRKKLLEDEVEIFNTLTQKKATSKLNLLNTQDRLQEVVGDLLGVVRERTAIETTILDLEDQLKTLEYTQENLALEELNDLTSELLEVREQINRSQDRVNRLEVLSPIQGIIKGLQINPGNVIAPAEVLFEIVPIGGEVIADIRISTNDIGHVTVGDPVQLKVDTYDFSTYGQISGYLKSVSASTFLDEENVPYFQGIVHLERNYLGDVPGKNRVFPGMTVSADIKTDQKSLFRYLLKPLNRTFYDAFRER